MTITDFDKEPQLLTPKQACAYVKRDKSTLLRWEMKGYLVPLRNAAGDRRYREADLDRVLAMKIKPGPKRQPRKPGPKKKRRTHGMTFDQMKEKYGDAPIWSHKA